MKYFNNPFNLRATKCQWLGALKPKNGFCQFDSLEHGVRAFFVLMRTYALKHSLFTVRSIITRFAPPSENNTEAYIKYVCDYMCFSSDDILTTDEQYWLLAHSMALYESSTALYYSDIEYVWNYYHIATKYFPVCSPQAELEMCSNSL